MSKLAPALARRTLAAHRVPRSVLLCDGLSQLSDLAAAVALPWWIAAQAGASGLAFYATAVAAATLLAMLVASPFGERWSKPRQITWGTAALGLLMLLQGALAQAGAFGLPAIVGLAMLQVLARAFVVPAREAVLVELTPPPLLPAALRQRRMLLSASAIAGPLLGATALSAAGVGAALALCSGLLLAASLVARRLAPGPAPTAAAGVPGAWWRELRAGLAAKWHMPMERGWTIVNFVVWIFQGPAAGMLIPLKLQSLGLQGRWLGLALGAFSLGALLGSAFGTELMVQRLGRYRVRIGLGVAEALSYVVVGASPGPWTLLAGLLLAGACNASMVLVGATHRALAIPGTYRVRLFAAGHMSTQVAGAIGPLLVAVALQHHAVPAVYMSWGLAMAASVLGLCFVPRLKEFLSLEHDAARGWYEREYPQLFTPPSAQVDKA